MISAISTQQEALNKLFKQHKVDSAFVFGSVTSEDFTDDSDIDILVNFSKNLDPLEQGELWWSLYDQLRDLFQRNIDLVTESSLKNPYFINQVDKTKQAIYG